MHSIFINIAGIDETLDAIELHGEEYLSQPFFFEVIINVHYANDKLISKPALLTLKLTGHPDRIFHGRIAAVTSICTVNPEKHLSQLLIRPWLAFLHDTPHYQIFGNNEPLTTPEIIQTIFQERQEFDFDVSLLSHQYCPLRHCVQYGETDFEFVSRLMLESGIHYHFKHNHDRHTLVLADSNAPFTKSAELNPLDHLTHDTCYRYQLHQRVPLHSNRYSYSDQGKKIISSHDINKIEHASSYQTTYLNNSESLISDIQKRDLAAKQINQKQFKARTHNQQLEPGMFVDITQHDSCLITAIEHHAFNRDNSKVHYYNSWISQPATLPFVPETAVTKPLASEFSTYWLSSHRFKQNGIDHATVIQHQKHASKSPHHLYLEFKWPDNLTNKNRNRAWVEIKTDWAGQDHGTQITPRADQIAKVIYQDGNPNRPLVIGIESSQLITDPLTIGITNLNQNGNHLLLTDKRDQPNISINAKKEFEQSIVGQSNIKSNNMMTTITRGNQTSQINKQLTIQAKEKISLKCQNSQVILTSSAISLESKEIEFQTQ